MSTTEPFQNRVRNRRLARDWSQSELAGRAGISRAAVSAIEGNRLVPSVAAALALASVLECSVEELFSMSEGRDQPDSNIRWAWEPVGLSHRFWCARIQDRIWFYPAEATAIGEVPHDGLAAADAQLSQVLTAKGKNAALLSDKTLVIAGCDPAVGLLTRLYERTTGYRMLAFTRSSRQALELVARGLVHAGGVHLSSLDERQGNAKPVRDVLKEPARLLRVTDWQEGIAVGSSVTATSVRGVLKERLAWIGREPGSGARQCLDQLLQGRLSPKRTARDHRSVAEAIRNGWADAGVCLRLVADEAGLRFLPIRTEGYDFCVRQSVEQDPRVRALIQVLQSPELKQLMGELPGYDSRWSGQVISVE